MDKKSKLIQYIFDTFKNSRERKDDELFDNFTKYFNNYYEKRISEHIDDDYVIYSIIEELEKFFLLSDDDIKKIIITDVSFEKMLTIRKKILNLCIVHNKEKLNEVVIQELNDYLLELDNLKNQVKEFNQLEAFKIYADSGLDINYLNGMGLEKSMELAQMLD